MFPSQEQLKTIVAGQGGVGGGDELIVLQSTLSKTDTFGTGTKCRS